MTDSGNTTTTGDPLPVSGCGGWSSASAATAPSKEVAAEDGAIEPQREARQTALRARHAQRMEQVKVAELFRAAVPDSLTFVYTDESA